MSRIAKDLVEGPHNPQSYSSEHDTMHRLSKHRGKFPNIAIVGTGMAGLRCADVLIRSGAKVTMFEARDRTGGRVHQAKSAGRLCDLGPNWIHGTIGNPIETIAKRTRTVLYEPEEDSAVYDSDGKRKTDEEAAEMSETVWGMILNAFKYSDEHSEDISPHRSLLDYFEDHIPKQEKDPAKVSDLLKLAQMWGPFIGDPLNHQSLKFFWLEQCIDGPNPYVAGTYKDILAEVGRNATANATIHFNTEIVHFDVSSPSPANPDHTLTITTASGTEHASFDEVVITCPLGWLKQNNSTAFPPFLLPPRLTDAISNMGYGRLEKIYVTFPRAFWLPDTTSTSNSTTKSPRTKPYPQFSHFLTPNYVSHDPSIAWDQSPISLAHLPEPTDHPTLLFYLYGPCATTVVKSITDLAPNSPQYNQVLDTFAQPFYSRLPNYDPAELACIPTAFLATQWQNDRFAGNGSYTNFPVGLGEADKDIECMRNAGGLGEKIGLWLAGEHTAPFVALGTTTGAYWAGEGVARRICGKWGVEVAEDEEGAEVPLEQSKATMREGHEHDAAKLNGMAL